MKNHSSKKSGPSITPMDVARGIRAHLSEVVEPRSIPPAELYRWGRGIGLEAQLRRTLDPEWKPKPYNVTGEMLRDVPLKGSEVREALRKLISYDLEAFQEMEATIAEVQKVWLKAQAKKIEDCGTTWRGHVVRVFWRDRRGRERLRRQVGIHRCKNAWCPTCGRSRQAKIAGEVEKLLILSEDWGFHSGHARLVTLTGPNSPFIPTAREEIHHAWHKFQNTRWYKRHVFGFVRGSEVLTGEDGNWNFHIHLLVIFWHPRMDYGALSEKWTEAMGGKLDGKNYVMDVESLERRAWERKDGKAGPLGRRNLVRAARYISKYISKPEELAKLKGPGGLGHLLTSTKGMRRVAFGGGVSVLRRAAHVLMPRQLHQAEEVLAGSWLHEGKPPLRVEVMNPETGELVEQDPLPSNDSRTNALRAWGESLETNPEPCTGWKLPARVVGIPCGPNGRHRRLGPVPLASPQPTVKEWERRKGGAPLPLAGVRALVADGSWRVCRWSHWSPKRGKLLHFAAVLPTKRFSWRPVQQAVLGSLGLDAWAITRRRANAAAATHSVNSEVKEDTRRHLRADLGQSELQARALRTRFESERRRLQLEGFKEQEPAITLSRVAVLDRAIAHLDFYRPGNPA